jgi:hypothetical protein
MPHRFLAFFMGYAKTYGMGRYGMFIRGCQLAYMDGRGDRLASLCVEVRS